MDSCTTETNIQIEYLKKQESLISTLFQDDEYDRPLIIYFKEIIKMKCQELLNEMNKNLTYMKNKKIYYALKANSNKYLLNSIKEFGISGVDCVSQNEIRLALESGFEADELMYTNSSSSFKELLAIMKQNITINFNDLESLEYFCSKYQQPFSFSMRLNIGKGLGHHKYVETAGKYSKFGMMLTDFEILLEIIKKHKLNLIGLHHHSGSNITMDKIEEYLSNIQIFLQFISLSKDNLPDLKFMNLGGGFFVRYQKEDKIISMDYLFSRINYIFESNKIDQNLIVIFEPGRFIVAEGGILLTKINVVKKRTNQLFIGCDSGMNHLVRPSLYQSFHNVVNISNHYFNWDENRTEEENCDIINLYGNICESTDFFVKSMKVKKSAYKVDDVLAILNCGAYCFSMSSNFNLRLKPKEYIIDDKNQLSLIRELDRYENIV
jgi:diaminopimelate decarboxylase